MYGLQGTTKENIPTSKFETIHFSRTNQTNITHSTRSNICTNNQTKFLWCHKYRTRATHKPNSSANQRYTRLKKYDEKPFQANGNYAKPPHNLQDWTTKSELATMMDKVLGINTLFKRKEKESEAIILAL
jgi:hypothetical protein